MEIKEDDELIIGWILTSRQPHGVTSVNMKLSHKRRHIQKALKVGMEGEALRSVGSEFQTVGAV